MRASNTEVAVNRFFIKSMSRFLITALMALAIAAVSGCSRLDKVDMEDKPLAKPLPINTRPRILAIGQGFSVGVKKDGTVWSWGKNYRDALLGRTSSGLDALQPAQVPGLQGAVSVVASSSHTLVLLKDGTVWSWGENDHGQLGYPTEKDFSGTPRQVPGLSDVVDIAAMWGVSQALKKDGTVWGFGWGTGARLGLSAPPDHNPVMQVEGLKNIARIEVGYGVSMAIDRQGRLWTYGDSTQRLGQGEATPGVVNLPRRVVDASANSDAVFALLEDGTVWSWGYNYGGQLGTGEKSEQGPRGDKGRMLPARIPSLSSIVLLASGMGGAVVAEDGTIATWGTAAGGAPQNMTVSNLSTPHALKENLPGPIQYLVGGEAYAVVDARGDAWFWQSNSHGQRGNNSKVKEPSAQYWTTPEKSFWSRN